MTKQEFKDKNTEIKKFFDDNINKSDGMFFVVMTEAHSKEEGVTYNDVIGNIEQTQVRRFCTTILRIFSSLMGRMS